MEVNRVWHESEWDAEFCRHAEAQYGKKAARSGGSRCAILRMLLQEAEAIERERCARARRARLSPMERTRS